MRWLPLHTVLALACAGDPAGRWSAAVTPAELTVADLARCVVTGPPAVIEWTVGGAPAGSGPTLAAPAFRRGDRVACAAGPSAGHMRAHSAPVAVVDAPPTAPVAEISPAAPVWGVDDLRCAVAAPATDPDGDAIEYTVQWSSPVVGESFPAGEVLAATVPARASTYTCVIVAAAGGRATSSAPARVSPSPAGGNILFLLADDVGVDKIGAYGEHPDAPPTPTIDALAAAGVLFRNAYAAPVCSATRANVLTGRYGRRTGVVDVVDPWTWGYALPDTEITVPRALALSPWFAYTAEQVGKWHLGPAPTARRTRSPPASPGSPAPPGTSTSRRSPASRAPPATPRGSGTRTACSASRPSTRR